MLVRLLARIVSMFMLRRKWRKSMRIRIMYGLYTLLMRKKCQNVGESSIATGPVTLNKRTKIGKHTSLSSCCILGGGEVVIGDHVICGPNLVVQTQNHNYESDALPFGFGYTCKTVRIDDCVWIGMNVMLLPGTHICEGAIIQMGSVVHGEIPPCAIAGGNPAKVFAWRDKERYKCLKDNGRFTHS